MYQPSLTHRFVAEFVSSSGAVVTAPLDMDWVPAIECAHFSQLRLHGGRPTACAAQSRVLPRWDSTAGAPYVESLSIGVGEGASETVDIPARYFSDAAGRAALVLARQGRLPDGETHRYRICAYPSEGLAACTTHDGGVFSDDDVESDMACPPVIPIRTRLAQAPRHGPEHTMDMPVLIDSRVLEETRSEAMAAGDLETGGIMLGRLVRDSDDGDFCLEVTAQIAAREAIQDTASLRFTPNTWRAVDAAVRLRKRDEKPVGWWHSHPSALWPCRKCPAERRAGCASNKAVFSTFDVGFHRTAFQGAHNVALLLSFLSEPSPQFDLFGWRQGTVAQRGFHQLKENDHDQTFR